MSSPNNPAAVVALAAGDLDNFLVAATPGGIERQEAQGQAALVANFTTLPRQGLFACRVALENLGFVFGDYADDLFINVTPPAGWSLKATEHAMHSDLLDDKGRRRGSVFYKAAFYDRNAEIYMIPRYQVVREYGRGDTLYDARHVIKDNADASDIHAFPTIHCAKTLPREERKAIWDAQDAQAAQARAWLLSAFPDHESVEAYW